MTNKELVVVAGPAGCGKTPLAQLWAYEKGWMLVHRDQLRTLLYNPIDERDLTLIQADLAKSLLSLNYSVIVVGQNQASTDKILWERTAKEEGAKLSWCNATSYELPEPTHPSRRFTPDDFEEITNQTALYPEKGSGSLTAVTYCALGLGEAGEVQGKLKKVWRGDKTLEENREALLDELGDTLWYVVRMAMELGGSLQHLLNRNGRKLLSRKLRGTLQGSGDNR